MSEQDFTRPIRGQDPDSQWYVPQHDTDTLSAPPPPPPVMPPKRNVRLSRRGLIIGAGAVGVGAVAITTGILAVDKKVTLPFTPQPAEAASNQVQHLLRRAGFGGRASEVQQYHQMSMDGVIEQLLNYNAVTDDIDTRLQSLDLDLTKVTDMQRWWILRMIYSKRPLQEKMTLFWHGLLTSSYAKVGGKSGYGYMVTQNNFFRSHAMDTFDNILLGITQDPAMMWWLDLRLSRKNAPNENYARELMELFTLGVNSGYTQSDVHDAARALTGFQLSRTGTVSYNAAQHDSGQKTLLGQTGNLDYHDVIRIVTSHPAAGPYLCKRLFQFFVHENPSDADVKPMVDAYYSKGHSILEVMRAMFKSSAFFSPQAYRSRIKSPTEFVVGAIRQLDLDIQGQGLSTAIVQTGQTLFDPPNVAGWPGDVASDNWMSTSTWLSRANYVNAIFNSLPTGTSMFQNVINTFGLKTPDDLVQHYVGVLIDGQISAARRQMLTQFMTASASGGTLQLQGGQSVPEGNVRGLLYLLMASPDYQLN